jgi:hypothetical protein
MHRRGVLEIPSPLDVPIQDVYRALIAVLPATGSYRLSQTFADHSQKEAATFGSERVHAFCRRNNVGRSPSTRRGQICTGLLLLCGMLWCLAYAAISPPNVAREYEPWLVFGILLSVLSVLGWFLLYLRQHSDKTIARSLENAELVISPTGIAVKQGTVQGHLRWEELLDVRLPAKAPFSFVLTGKELTGGIQLIVAGARIRIADVYDRPIALIYRLIRGYWKGE